MAEEVDVENELEFFCDPKINVDSSTILVYIDKAADLFCDHPEKLAQLLQTKDISPFLNALKEHLAEFLGPVTDVLDGLFGLMSPHMIMTKYWRNLADGLAEQVPHQIQTSVLRQLQRISKDSKAVVELAANEELLGLIIDRMDNSFVRLMALDVLARVCLDVPGAYKSLVSEPLWSRIQKVQSKDAVCRVGVDEVYCRIAVCCPDAASRMTPQLQSIVDSSRAAEKDILVTLNYVQLLAVLVGSKHTLQFIKGSGVIEDMKKLLQDTTHRNAVFLEPSVCEFFGRFGENHPQTMSAEYPEILSFMIDLTEDPQFKHHAVNNLGLIGRTHDGKRCMQKLKLNTGKLMKSIGDILTSHDDDGIQKAAALSALAHLLEVEDSKPDDIMAITQSWFSSMCEDPVKAVWDCAKYPDKDTRKEALGVFHNIALLTWGRDTLLEDTAGFYEWILHRDRSASKDETEAKFNVISALVEDSNKIKCPEKRNALRAHYNEGPYPSSRVNPAAVQEEPLPV